MQLPDRLKPWAEWLAWFDPALWPSLADLLPRLGALLGPVIDSQAGGAPEPDGLGDLQRRGPYERLLASEWLLADALPDEFLRRAAAGEHLFLAPRQRPRQATGQMLVLFDAGPTQWGAPRLVHLALMILLARRARAAGGELLWGTLQAPGQVAPMDNAQALRQMLAARTEVAVQPSHWQAWRSWLDAQEPFAQCWGVGVRLAGETLPFSHRLRVQRTLDGQGMGVCIEGRPPRQVVLPLPDAAASQRLLTGQFGTRPVTRRLPGQSWRVALTFAPVISAQGTQVALQLLDEPGALVFQLPPAGSDKPPRAHRHCWPRRLKPVACAFFGKQLTAILSDAATLTFWHMPRFDGIEVPARETFQMPVGTATQLPFVRLGRRDRRVYCLDRQHRLVYWQPTAAPARRLHAEASGVLGLAQVGQASLAYVRQQSGQLFLEVLHDEDFYRQGSALGVGRDATQVLFAGSPGPRCGFVPCAVYHGRGSTGTWQVHDRADDPRHQHAVNLARGYQAIGLLHDAAGGRFSLVLMSTSRQSFFLYQDQQVEPLFTCTAPSAHYSFCAVSGMLAVLTRQRELLVFAVRERLMRLQVLCTDDVTRGARHD